MTPIDRLENDLALSGDISVTVSAADLRALIDVCREATAQAEGMAEFAALKMEERDAAEAKLKALREAAGALVADLESSQGDWPRHCDAPRCRRLATLSDGDLLTCDEHQGDLVAGDIEDLSYAPALRALRAALKEEP